MQIEIGILLSVLSIVIAAVVAVTNIRRNARHDDQQQATFIYNSDKTETQKLGMIAEDVADVCPIAGMTDKDGKVENYDDRAIIAMLVAEVQRLNKLINKKEGEDGEVHQTLDGCHT